VTTKTALYWDAEV